MSEVTVSQKRLALLSTREEISEGVQQISDNVTAQLTRQRDLLITIEAIDAWLEANPAPIAEPEIVTEPTES